jgi:hypothetical protein
VCSPTEGMNDVAVANANAYPGNCPYSVLM